MAKPYTEYIEKNTSDSHQISPHWLVTFTRFRNRDTHNYGGNEGVRNPLVVENDCVSISVSTSKTNNTPSVTMVLLSGDLNYATAVAPGDFCIVNMVNSTSKARELRNRAVKSKAINRIGDGFKGIFKINTVSKNIIVNQTTGVKTLTYEVTAYGFTEFDNKIYFNPTIATSVSKKILTYNTNERLLEILGSKKGIQKALELLPTFILGNGKINKVNGNFVKTPYNIPKMVFQLLGIDGENAIDLYRIMIGKWPNDITGNNVKDGFNPTVSDTGSIQKLKNEIEGQIPIQQTSVINIRLMDLMKSFSNDLINETYTCFRVDKKTGKILPKLIIRQKPFNTEHGIKRAKGKPYEVVEGTSFLSLPRWKISADLIYQINTSKNESLRFNLVHIIGTVGSANMDNKFMAMGNGGENGPNNLLFDEADIEKHGLRPYTRTSNFDWIKIPTQGGHSPHWADLVFDWVHSGQLKSNGRLMCVGIEKDICIGDNLELQNAVYHIEDITHTGNISVNGIKNFRTTLTLSNGIDKRSSKAGPIYTEMDYTDTFLERKEDSDHYDILPGFSDTQDIIGRTDGEEVKETRNGSYTPSGLRKKPEPGKGN